MRRYVWIWVLLASAAEVYAQPRRVTLDDAIQAALENNVDVAVADELALQARARASEQRAALLPDLRALAGYSNQTLNLGARGINFPGIATRVGPFSVADVRVQFFEPLLDLPLIRRYQSLKRSADASQSETEAVRSNVVALVSNLYFAVQRARGMRDALTAQVELDESLVELARVRREAGVGTGLDVTRAENRLATDRHSLLRAQHEVRAAELRLQHAMGTPLGAALDLVDALAPLSSFTEPGSLEDAIGTALRNRPEMKKQQQNVDAARLIAAAARAERLPSMQVFADYGTTGSFSTMVPTRLVGVQISLPLFDSGRRSAHRDSGRSQLRQAQAVADDIRDRIELETRLAFDALASAREQLAVGQSGLKLAQEELEVARLRFENQVTTQIDVLAAQSDLAAARSRNVDALFAVRSAEIEYRRTLHLGNAFNN